MKKRADGLLKKSFRIELPGHIKKRIYVYGHSVQEINRKIAQYKIKVEEGRLFETVADEWWEQHAKTLAPNSLRNYGPAVKRAVEAFGTQPIKDLTAAQISGWIKFLSAGFADKTVRTHLMVVNLIMLHAVNAGDIQYNPATAVRVPRNLPKTKITSPGREQIEKIKDSVDLPFGLFPFMALATGLRLGELLGLKWTDFRDGVIHVNRSVYWANGKAHIKTPKTKAGERVVPVLDILAPYIKKDAVGLVFPGKDGAPMTVGYYHNALRKYQRASGVTCSIHSLRHAFATLLYEYGVDPKDAQQILGHAQISTTLDIYTDISKEKLTKTFDKIRTITI